jgi:hypothetical protein
MKQCHYHTVTDSTITGINHRANSCIIKFLNKFNCMFHFIFQVDLGLNASVELAVCTCPRGLFRCHHIAVVLLYAHKNISCTDKECVWAKRKVAEDVRYRAIQLYCKLVFHNNMSFVAGPSKRCTPKNHFKPSASL